jgi:hypothetical protein
MNITKLPLIAIIVFMQASCERTSRHNAFIATEDMDKNINLIVSKMDACPSWYGLPGNDIEIRKDITNIYKELNAFNTETIRFAMERLLSRVPRNSNEVYRDSMLEKKIFALSRVVFDIPPGLHPKSIFDVELYWETPTQGDKANILWPYDLDGKGNLILTGIGGGGLFTGPSAYSAIKEFDLLAKHFKRRKL